ncbi:MAG: ATP-dependent helicase [Clostridia bacterium]|nr:ATP-dependent helicase [Clostridia bacterium]
MNAAERNRRKKIRAQKNRENRRLEAEKMTGFLNEGDAFIVYGFRFSRFFCLYPKPRSPLNAKLSLEILEQAAAKPNVRRAVSRERKKRAAEEEKARIREEQKRKEQEDKRLVRDLLSTFGPEKYQTIAAGLDRTFHLHVGPTNSGKTHDALQALKQADSGLYLGPLRLLALEMFDRLNADGVPCNLLTGEEEEQVPGASITASTIELCDYSRRFDVVVIDEAQMIEDKSRGSHWTRALMTVDAREIHVCMAPQALPLIQRLLDGIPAPYEIHMHERLVPLVFSGSWRELKDIEKGDAVIAFSRRQVLNIAAHLESMKIPASVIYGSLPPAARREEVRRFAAGETKVAVATDAIGMGISLPIRRILFFAVEKYDGERTRDLNASEIQQIAGRAGRFGMYDLGEVLTLKDAHRVRLCLEAQLKPLHQPVIPFPRSVLDGRFPLRMCLEEWNKLPPLKLFRREDLSEALVLYDALADTRDSVLEDDMQLLFDLITCPVDVKNTSLVYYWRKCAMAALIGIEMPKPMFGTETLEECERQYHAYDIYNQMSRRIRKPVSVLDEKDAICKRINELLKTDKKLYLTRCRNCGKKLPWNSPYLICDKCYIRNEYFGYNFGDW